METHNTRLAPASPLTTWFQHPRMWPPSGVCRDQVASTVSTKCPSSRGAASPRVAREPTRPHSAPGDSPFPPEHRQVGRWRVAAFALPSFTLLMELKPSPFSFLLSRLVPAAVSSFPLSLQLLSGRGASVFSLPPLSQSSLCLQKWFPTFWGFLLPRFSSP